MYYFSSHAFGGCFYKYIYIGYFQFNFSSKVKKDPLLSVYITYIVNMKYDK